MSLQDRERERERTPMSPSPSPEPAGAAAGPGAEGASGHSALRAGHADTGQPQRGAAVPITADEEARRFLEDRIRIAVDDLMQLATCAAEVNEGDEDIVRHKVNETMESLQALQDAADLPDLTHLVPEEVMGLIDTGRNPDGHTRAFANRLNSDNQQMRGQAQNFDLYRGRLRDKLTQAFPEMKPELDALDGPA